MNDPKHCGNCETDCTQSGQTCVHGKCYSKLDLKPCKKADSDTTDDSVVACYKLKDEAKWVTAEEYAQNLDKYELESGDPNCISPYNEATCGAVNCSEYTECSDPYICMKGDDGFQCVCPNGMVEVPNADGNGKHCADPFAEDHCGITAENPAGSKGCLPGGIKLRAILFSL